MSLTALVLSLPLLAPTPVAPAPSGATAALGDHGKLPWFEGSYSDVLSAAKAEGKPVMLDFWTRWCGWCKRLDRDVFSNDAVVESMEGFLVWNADAESTRGGKVARRFKVASFPTLIFLDPDGSPRDMIRGYLPPDEFEAEVRRLLRNEDTIGGYEARIEANPDDLDARIRLVRKYELFNDRIGLQRELREIEARDPNAETVAGEYCRLEREKKGILMHWQQTRSIDTSDLEAFLKQSKYPEVRHAGWTHVATTRSNEAQQESGRSPAERIDELRMLSRNAYEAAWKDCPAQQRIPAGVDMLNRYCEPFDLNPQQKSFALRVARSLAELAPEDPPVLDALARAEQASGAWKEARLTMQRCLDLEPDNPRWKRRMQELEQAQ